MTWIAIVIRANVSKLLLLTFNSSKYEKFTKKKTTPKLQNYHFALGGNILGLISKNYYKVRLTRISWIYNLYEVVT